MILLWMLLIIAVIIFLRYAYLFINRAYLIVKINNHAKKHGGSMSLRRNPLLSVFKHDGNTDIVLRIKDKTIDISVITTPLRRVRYHFDINNRLLELIIERRAVFMLNPRVPKPSAVMDRVYTIRKYKMKIEVSEDGNPKFVILNPAPVSISKAYGASQTALYNNDDLIPGVKVCGLKWFVKNVH